ACTELDADLGAAGVAAHHPDRRCLLRIRERLVDEPGTPAQEILGEAYASVAVACWTLLARLEHAWHVRRLAVVARKSALHSTVAPRSGWLAGRHEPMRFLDFDLLRQAIAAVAD